MNWNEFLIELKRRRVYRATALYVIVALGIWQAADIAVPALDLPTSVLRFTVVGAIVGLPLAVLLAWLFDLHVIHARPGRKALTAILATAVALSVTVLVAAHFLGEAGQDISPQLEPLPPPKPLLTAVQLGAGDSVRAVIRDEASFAAAWQSATQSGKPPLPIPAIDFAREMVILAVSPRQRPDDGIAVDSLMVTEELMADGHATAVMTVGVVSTVGCAEPAEKGWIVVMLQTKRFDGPIRWNERRRDAC
jgi:hypothetical protein